LIDNYPDTFVAVEYHTAYGPETPFGDTRIAYYGITGTPGAWFDGGIECSGAYTDYNQQYNWYHSQYTSRASQDADVTIAMFAYETSAQTYEIEATFCVEPSASTKTMVINMVQVLDHWPTTISFPRNTVRQGVNKGTITLGPGECETLTHAFTLTAESWTAKEDTKMVVWAQETGSAPAWVYQAAQVAWPFEPPPASGDFDADGFVGLADYEVFYDCMAGPEEDPVPTGTTADDCLRVFDFDEDEDVDAQDALSFMSVFTGSPPYIITHPGHQLDIPEGGTATFVVVAGGSAPLSYQWEKGAYPLEGATEYELIIEDVTPADAGWYRCIVTNALGEANSNSGMLTVAE